MDELVKRLRAAKAVVFKNEDVTLLGEAADAIEDLEFACNRYEKDYKALCEYLPKWIPVEERIPQETQRCIVVSKCGEMAFAIYKGNGFQYPHYMGKATHWMPLPQAPKEE